MTIKVKRPIIGVPVTFFAWPGADDFEVLGYGRPTVWSTGKRTFTRVFIRRKEDVSRETLEDK